MKQRFILAILLAILGLSTGWSQNAPQGFNYQSVVRNAAGSAYANQTVTMLFSIRSGAANGQVIYTERHTTNTNEYGLVNLVIGRGEVLQGTFSAINWGGGPKYLTASVETSPNVFEELGSTELLSVPFALYAQNGGSGGGGSGDNWGAQTVVTDQTLKGNGTGGNPLGLAPQEAQVGQVLKWNGSQWVPQDDISSTGQNGGTVTEINTTNGITGGPISTAGTIGLSNTGVTPGPYGSASQIPVITIDAQGRVTNAFTVVASPGTINITGGPGIAVQPNGFNYTVTNIGDTNAGDDLTNTSTANGDVSGTFSNLQIKNDVVGSAELANNSVGTAEIIDGAVSNDDLGPAAVGTTNIINGAVTGAKLNSMSAATGQVLKWNGTTWAPAADQSGSLNLTGGAGITISGTAPNLTIANSGDTNPADDLTTATQAAGDVTGPFGNLQIAANAVNTAEIAANAVNTAKIADQAVTGAKIDDMGALNGQILKWNGATWAPATDAGGITSIVAGNGITVVPNGTSVTIANDGDTNPLDDITTQSNANGDVTGTFSNLVIKPGAVTNVKLATNSVNSTNIVNSTIEAIDLASMGASNGQVLSYTNGAWAPTTLPAVSGDNWGTQTTQTSPVLSGNGTAANPLTIAAQGAVNGQVLKYDGSAWKPANDNNTPDNWGTQTVQTSPVLSGNGTAATPLTLASQGATNGQILKWDDVNNTWKPSDDLVGTGGTGNNYAAGTSISITGTAPNFVINNTGDPNSTNEIQALSLAGNVLSLSLGGGSVTLPATGGGNTYSAGTGINITGVAPSQTIVNTGDLSNTNELQTISLAGNTVTLSNGGGSFNIDPSASNELQTLTQAGNTVTLSNGGGSVNVDPSTTNELQTISLAGGNLTLSNGGGTVALPSANTYAAGTGINITGTAPNFTITNTGDPSSTNELQNLQLNGTTLKITGTNSTVKFDTLLTGGGLGLWKPTPTGGHIRNNNTGNVGINTDTPSAKLHIKGGNEVVRLEGGDPMLSLSNSPTGIDGYLWQRSGALILGTRDSSGILLQTAQEGKGLHVDGNSGNVTIGAVGSSPQKLKVVHEDGGFMLENSGSGVNWEFLVTDAGSLALYNNQILGGSPAGVFAVNGNYTSSDRRLKKDIRAVPSVLSKLNQLAPVTYRFNREADNAPQSVGLIAQEVQVLFPELVSTSPVRNGEGGTLMVNYTGLSVIAVKAIQEQQTQIDQLKSENEQLRSRLETIEALLNKKK